MLELIDLRRRYGDLVALDGLTFEVPPGKVFGFLGPNGAGKTTDAGGVRAGGAGRWPRVLARRCDRRAGAAGVRLHARGAGDPGMRVLDQLMFLGRLHGLPAQPARAAALSWTERLGLSARLGDQLESLSLGNQQRAQLAAALVHSPELLVLDEPFSGLDPVAVDTFSAILAERAAAGATVLFSSHQLDLVEERSTNAVLDAARHAGTVEQFGFARRRLSDVFRGAVGRSVADDGSERSADGALEARVRSR